MARLEACYSLQGKLASMRERHDCLCDDVAALALGVDSAQKHGQELGPEVRCCGKVTRHAVTPLCWPHLKVVKCACAGASKSHNSSLHAWFT